VHNTSNGNGVTEVTNQTVFKLHNLTKIGCNTRTWWILYHLVIQVNLVQSQVTEQVEH